MVVATQYDIFEDPSISEVKAQVSAQKESLRKIQKSLFGRMGDMSKMLFELYAQNEQLNQKYLDAVRIIESMNERIESLESK